MKSTSATIAVFLLLSAPAFGQPTCARPHPPGERNVERDDATTNPALSRAKCSPPKASAPVASPSRPKAPPPIYTEEKPN